MKIKIAVGVTLLVILTGILVTVFQKEKVLATVGTVKITDKDIRLMMKAMKASSSTPPSESLILKKLVESHSLTELLKRRGVTNLDEAYKKEMTRMEWEEKGKRQTNQLKDFLGNDPEIFTKLVVVPRLATRLAFLEGYLKDDSFHQEKKKKAESFLKEALKQPGNFSEMAKKEKLTVIKGKWIKDQGVVFENPMKPSFFSDTLRPGDEDLEEEKNFNLEGLQPNTILGQLFERSDGWWIVKANQALTADKSQVRIETVMIPRDPFSFWLHQMKNVVPVEFGKKL